MNLGPEDLRIVTDGTPKGSGDGMIAFLSGLGTALGTWLGYKSLTRFMKPPERDPTPPSALTTAPGGNLEDVKLHAETKARLEALEREIVILEDQRRTMWAKHDAMAEALIVLRERVAGFPSKSDAQAMEQRIIDAIQRQGEHFNERLTDHVRDYHRTG